MIGKYLIPLWMAVSSPPHEPYSDALREKYLNYLDDTVQIATQCGKVEDSEFFKISKKSIYKLTLPDFGGVEVTFGYHDDDNSLSATQPDAYEVFWDDEGKRDGWFGVSFIHWKPPMYHFDTGKTRHLEALVKYISEHRELFCNNKNTS